uniref:Uncharacterized protein n=1 Tax=Mimivirus LCMiAC01 TaxID=2506608 RepID=A0A481Z0E8_9VIRU|nr:MAG: uncharacterized protein LCMiAC01_02140 [Mimivirus LCMiAC01]
MVTKLDTETFINRSISIHKNKYDYSKSIYVNRRTKIIVICKKHKKEFLINVRSHWKGFGCELCRLDEIKNKFIENANKIHNNKYVYTNVIYKTERIKVAISCPIKNHGIFFQKPHNHIFGHGCPKCALEKRKIIDKNKVSEFIIKANKLHNNIYDYTKINSICGERSHVTIICPVKEHGNFVLRVQEHLLGFGCPSCKTNKIDKQYLLNKHFIDKANKLHNNRYDYSKINYINGQSKLLIICPIHDEFIIIAKHHFYKTGCPECDLEIKLKDVKKRQKLFIERAKKIHHNKYNYTKVSYQDVKKKVIIICPKVGHDEFLQSPEFHLLGIECPKCRVGKVIDRFIKKSNEVHKNRYDYSKIKYVRNDISVDILCHKHGIFQKTPTIHLSGAECPKCNLCPSCQLWRSYGLCSYCKPKNKNKLYQKTKEMKIVKFLRTQLPDHEFIHNKSVGRDCTDGHLFPDIRFDCNNYQLIIEVDEHKHRGANYRCDKQRMYDIIAKLGQPCIFIRYNPDNKKSKQEILLKKVKKYLELEEDTKPWNKYGYKAVYLFY